jgi:SAM-dependent methyltransferase/DNA-binding NarL/FixJ family response regulator
MDSITGKHLIVCVDDELQVIDALRSDLEINYKNKFHIEACQSAEEALSLLSSIETDKLFLVISDQRMPKMRGVEFLSHVRKSFPDTRNVLLTAYSDINVAIDAINTASLDHYILKPWSPPSEKLFPVIDRLYNDFLVLQKERFFQHVTDAKEREELVRFSSQFDPESYPPRTLEDHSIAGDEEAKRYSTGTSYPENSDYILFSMELDRAFNLKGKRVLEFCTGPGDLTRVISTYGPVAVTGVDGSEYMVRFAKGKHFGPNLEYRLANLFELNERQPDLRNADLVVCQNSTHHFSEKLLVSFFKVALDLLKPGGMVYVSDYRREFLEEWVLAQRLMATNRHVRQDLVNTFLASFTKDEIVQILSSFGSKISFDVFYPDSEYVALKKDPRFKEIVAQDPHPHYLDYKLSLRIKIEKLQ